MYRRPMHVLNDPAEPRIEQERSAPLGSDPRPSKTGSPRLLAVCTGRVAQLRHLESAILKAARSTLEEPRAVLVHPWGLEGDEQAEQGVHGGRDKAVYMAPVEHWPFWNAQRQERGLDPALGWGFVGENLSVEGLLEAEIYPGDRIELGEVVLEVTEPRIPCLKFNIVMGYAKASRHMLQSGRSGWYCAVLRGGSLKAGLPITIRPGRRLASIAGLLQIRQSALQRELDFESPHLLSSKENA